MLSLIQNKSYEIDIESPTSGPFVAHGAIENDAPDFLLGPGLTYAIKAGDIGTHNKMYVYFGDASEIPPSQRITLRPASNKDPVPPLFLMGTITDKIEDFVLNLKADGNVVSGKWQFEQDTNYSSDAQYAVLCTLIGEEYGVRARVIFPSMSVLPIIEGIIFRLDREARQNVHFEFSFGEQVVWGHGDPETSTSYVHKNTFVMEARIPLNGIVPFEIGLAATTLTEVYDSGEVRETDVTEAPTELGQLIAKSVEAVRSHGRRFWFKRTTWNDEFLGMKIDTNKNNLNRSSASRWNLFENRPYDSAVRPSQGGTQNSFGLSFYVPLWGTGGGSVIHQLKTNAFAWLDRPAVVFDPVKMGFPINPDNIHEHARTEMRQFYHESRWSVEENFPGQNVPHSGSRDPLTDRGTPNQTHVQDMPLFAAYAMTGSFILKCQIEFHNAMDLRQKEVHLGWVGVAREEGRVGQTMLTAMELIPELRDSNIAHMQKRYDNVIEKSFHKDPAIKMFSHNPLVWANLEGKSASPWENAQMADGFMRLYRVTGDVKYAVWAHRYARIIPYSSINRNGDVITPYVVRVNPDGTDYYFPPNDRWNRRDYYAFSETATNWARWSCGGARALLDAAVVMWESGDESLIQEVLMHSEAIDWSVRLVSWFDNKIPGDAADAHMGMWKPSSALPYDPE